MSATGSELGGGAQPTDKPPLDQSLNGFSPPSPAKSEHYLPVDLISSVNPLSPRPSSHINPPGAQPPFWSTEAQEQDGGGLCSAVRCSSRTRQKCLILLTQPLSNTYLCRLCRLASSTGAMADLLLVRLILLPILTVLSPGVAQVTCAACQPLVTGWSLLCVARTVSSILQSTLRTWRQLGFHALLLICLLPFRQLLHSHGSLAELQASTALSQALASAEVRDQHVAGGFPDLLVFRLRATSLGQALTPCFCCAGPAPCIMPVCPAEAKEGDAPQLQPHEQDIIVPQQGRQRSAPGAWHLKALDASS